ncbi:hypothetical protein [Aliiroseovarius crassostreae]|uniref:hypothetical protein n=1 Tax=Aliiroseovarius crassostreae TaxID=154981 RepID=UPI002882F706|nr:hypothetical protein [Aliiroseovarius crassostreae]
MPAVLTNIEKIRALRSDSPGVADPGTDTALSEAALEDANNLALQDWKGRSLGN